MTRKLIVGIVLLAVALVGIGFCWWMHGASRRESLASLSRLDEVLHSGNRDGLLGLVIMPAAVRDRSAAEQTEFLAKALTDEISPEGLAALEKRGSYGPLKELFPAQAESWATQAGVKPEDCVAFKMKRNGLRAEVVLVKPPASNAQRPTGEAPYRIVRVNNVKQMAQPESLSTTEQIP